jgi:4-carboxymuconolactone decarboxylase
MSNAPRLTPLRPSERSEEQRQMLAEVGSEKNIFTTFVRHPALFDDFRRFSGRLLRQSTLPPIDRETLILRTAFRCGAEYQWAQHVEIARQVGVPSDVIVAAGSTDSAGDADEHTLLLITAADGLLINRHLDDSTWSALLEHYSEAQMIELCMLVGECAMVAGVLNSLGVPLETGQLPRGWEAP